MGLNHRRFLHSLLTIRLQGFLFGYDIGVISVRGMPIISFAASYKQNIQGCLAMPDFIQRFGEAGPDGAYVLSSARQSIIVVSLSPCVLSSPQLIVGYQSLLPAGCLLYLLFSLIDLQSS